MWRQGIIAPWYLRPSQLDVYSFIRKTPAPFVEASRRWGKTTTFLVWIFEQLLKHRGWVCRWCEPWKNQAREIIMPEIDKIQGWAPSDQKFHFHSTDSVYVGPGNSRLYLRGINDDKGESARGPFANIVVCDEYGTWKDPDYIVRSILRPQLLNQEGGFLLKGSTPPVDLGHKYYSEKSEAMRKNRFIQKTIHDNEALSKEEIEKEMEEAGGAQSHTWRREYLCEPVSDPELLVIPEFNDSWVIDDDESFPGHYDCYVSGDSGADDNTAILFGHYDFLKDWLVIDDEFVVSGSTTDFIVGQAKQKEKDIYKDKEPFRRVYDAPEQVLLDIRETYKYKVWLPLKADKHAGVREFRVKGKQGKVKIRKRCKQLIWQLKVGLWKDKKHTDFERSESLGHLDAVAAAIYLNRAIDTSRNPYPAQAVNPYIQLPPLQPTPANPDEEALARLLRPFGNRG